MADGPPSYAASSSCSTTSGEGQGNDSNPMGKSPSGTKRRASRAGTRSVSTLTPAQLQRKRANDREAQRAIRQRNKEHIENLERRIEELSVGNIDAATLVSLKQRVRELEDELSKANEHLAVSRTQQISSHPVWQARSNGGLVHPSASFNNNSSNALVMSARSSFAVPAYDGHSATFNNIRTLLVAGPEDSKDFLLDDDSDLQRSWVHPSLGLENTNSMAFGTTAPYPHQVPAFYQPSFSAAMGSSSFMSQPSMHAFEVPIRYAQPSGMFDNLLISVIQTQRRQILEGTGPEPEMNPQLGALIKTGTRSPIPVTEPISQALSRILCDYTVRMSLAETAACFYIIHKILQWQIAQDGIRYEQLPAWYTPLPVQLTQMHPLSASLLVWPKLREKIINDQSVYANAEFFNILGQSMMVNWPYGERDILMFVGGEMRITPTFEKHIRRLESWSLGPVFQQRYPELADYCRFG